jgi:3-methyladenine DNA glycosylase AlkD
VELIKKLQNELDQCSSPEARQSGERFFKEPVRFRGLRSAMVTTIAKKYYKLIPDKSKETIFNLCEELWQSGFIEDTFIASQWAYSCRKQFTSDDINRFEKWVTNYLDNWASTDGLCNHTIGALIEMFPENLETLKKWTQSPNRWARRAAAVSLIVPAKKGMFLDDVFEIALMLLNDKEDMVQKGYGWMLKATSQAHQEEVFNYVMSKKAVMPRTALRYAIEKMPEELRKEAMKK